MAHLVAEPGSEPMLSLIGPRYPLMVGKNIVPFGYAPREPIAVEQAFLLRHGIDGYPILKVRGRATPAAVEVRSRLESGTGRFLVYFDIDVIDFVEFPAADALQPNQGLTFPDAFAALQIFCASPKFGGLIVTEFNPDHDDKEGTLAKQLIESLAQALQS
jgi:arginase